MKKLWIAVAMMALLCACTKKEKTDCVNIIGKPEIQVQDGRFTPEVMWALGLEYSYRNLFFFRTGYFHESPYKGNRQFISLGAGIKYSVFGIDVSYLIATQQYHPLANTLRFTLNFDFVSTNKNELKQQGRLR